MKNDNLNKLDYYFMNVLSYACGFGFIIAWFAAIWLWQYRVQLFFTGLLCIFLNHFAETNIKAYKLKNKNDKSK